MILVLGIDIVEWQPYVDAVQLDVPAEDVLDPPATVVHPAENHLTQLYRKADVDGRQRLVTKLTSA